MDEGSQIEETVSTPAVEDAPRDRTRVAPASFGQQSLFFLRQIMPCKTPYNTAVQLRLSGELDAGALAAALIEVARRHESFRTTFTLRDGVVLQVIAADASPDVAVVDLASSAAPLDEERRLTLALAAAPFDLERGPLLRARVFRLGPAEHALSVVMDHIVADGLSLDVLWREVEVLYRAFRAGEPSPLAPPPRQFTACVEAQNAWMATPAFARQLAGWARRLAGASPCDLPADRPRPPIKSFRGGFASRVLPRALADRVRALAAAEDVTLFTVIFSALALLVARCGAERGVLVMIPVACRQRFAADRVIGFLSNFVVLRLEVDDDAPYRDLLRRAGAEIMNGVLRQDVPFEKVVEAVRPERSLSHDPLARIALSFLPGPAAAIDLPGVAASYAQIPNGGSKLDLHVTVTERDGDLLCVAEYNSDIFEPGTMDRLLGHYATLLDAAAADPGCAAGDLPLLTHDERRRALVEWNEGAGHRPGLRGAGVAGLVAAAAARAPESVAASSGGHAITYRELVRRGRKVARCLRARGVGPEVRVGIAVERSIAMLVGLLGILEAGGAYVPLDPAHPRERLARMAEGSGILALVAEDRFAGVVPVPERRLLRLDADAAEIAAQSGEPIGEAPHPEALAYVMSTSGSTGKPKGVGVPNRAVEALLAAMADRPGLGPSDRLLAVTSLSFDIAGLELWLPLVVGAHVEIASRETAGDGRALARALEEGRITAIQATPATFRILVEAAWEGDRALTVLVGGEATPRDLADALVDRAGSVWNMYGPTETTIWSCVQPLARGGPMLVGRPIAGTQAYVVDRRLAPVPVGVTGELLLGGEGVARGYVGQPDLTADRFIPDPFSGVGGRLYRTGDLCRRRPDGSIEILGRADLQVKVRGHRIELGEIEAALAAHPGVREAAVAVREAAPGDPRIVAYVVARDGADVAPGDLLAHLKTKLPEPMLPSRFVVMDRLPLTANNKIDRRALPAPGRADAPVKGGAGPREAHEFALRAIWEEILGIEGAGLHDGFFDLGGHSLLALKLFDRIERAFGVKLPVASLFQAPTIAALGELLRREGWEPSWSSLVPIQTSGARPPFFCVHAVGGNVLNYRLLSRRLGDDQPFYGLQSRGLGGNEAPHATVEEMAAAYVREIAAVQRSGPYRIGGSSSGAVIAYEMAQQLHARGERVERLLMMDGSLVGTPTARAAEAMAASPLHRLAFRLDLHAGHLLLRTPRAGLAYLASRVKALIGGTAAPIEQTMRAAPAVARHVFEANVRALARYVPRPYPGAAVMLLSRDEPDRAVFDQRLAWADLVEGGLVVRFIPGDHENMLDEPHVAGVARVIAQCLA
jgi:amino acid adenylation domain-containing protein